MLQLENRTSFSASIDKLYDPDGSDVLIITAKANFSMEHPTEILGEYSELIRTDEYWGEMANSSLKRPSDICLIKSSTDIAMSGHSYAPGQKEVEMMDVSLSVGAVEKTVRVYGDRIWIPHFFSLKPSRPRPFESMPMVYERAYGGHYKPKNAEDKIEYESKNPVGIGFRGNRKPSELKGEPLPNLEDPTQPILSPKDTPPPAGFSWIASNWEPRKSLLGTFDTDWEKNRMPYLPMDFDPRSLQAAHPRLIPSKPLTGGEEVIIKNMSPDGEIRFALPSIDFVASADFGANRQNVEMTLSSLHLEPNEKRFSMVWHGSVRHKHILQCKSVELDLKQIEPNSGE